MLNLFQFYGLVFVLIFSLSQINCWKTWHIHETHTAWHGTILILKKTVLHLLLLGCFHVFWLMFQGMAEKSVGQVVDMWLKVMLPFFLSLLHDLILFLYIAWNKSVIKVHLLPTYYCNASLPFCFICTLFCVPFTLRLFCLCMY